MRLLTSMTVALGLLAAACTSTPSNAPAAATSASGTVAAVAPTVVAGAPTVVAAAKPTVAAAATTVAQAAPTVGTAVAQAAPPVGTAVAQAAPTVVAAVAGAATAAARPVGAPVTITMWHGMNGTDPGTQGGTLQTLVNQYKQIAPNVTINLDFTPYTGNELQDKVTGAIVAHNTPDLVQGFEQDIAAWYQAGAIVALDDYAKNSLTQADLDDIQKALLDSGRFPQYENRLLSFPFNRSIYVVYFNKPELSKAGFPNGPKTWDDVNAACAKIVADMPCYAIQPSADAFMAATWNRGGDVISSDFKKAIFNGPEGVEALTFDVTNIKNKNAYVSKGFDWQNDFGAQKVAMSPVTTIAGDPFIAQAVNGAFEISMAPVPIAPGKPLRSLFSGTNLAIMKSTPDKQQAAWDFIKWLTETKQSAFWTVQTSYLPVRKSALNEQIVKDYIAKTPRYQIALDMIPSGSPGISVAGWTEARTALQDAITNADALTVEPKAALDDAAKKADDALARN
jgi:ABC-type glycerol-3-phosphate transport system substrate-binding protein